MKIGITEAGDASLDYTWLNKIDSCDGIILITKNVTDHFIKTILPYKHKIILHATCTGMGGTVVEPNVPNYKQQLAQVSKLIEAGFPKNQITVRIDPIVPTAKGLQTAQNVINASPVRHFRFSVLDTYPHVRARFKAAGITLPYGDSFQASNEQFEMLKTWLAGQSPADIFECCAEDKLVDVPNVCTVSCVSNVCTVGCVSENDINTLGLTLDAVYPTGLQRKSCRCLSCKTELLSHKQRCPHGCLYCYWKD